MQAKRAVLSHRSGAFVRRKDIELDRQSPVHVAGRGAGRWSRDRVRQFQNIGGRSVKKTGGEGERLRERDASARNGDSVRVVDRDQVQGTTGRNFEARVPGCTFRLVEDLIS